MKEARKELTYKEALPNGTNEVVQMPLFNFKSGTPENEMTAFNQEFFLTMQSFATVVQGYSDMLPHIARWVNTGWYKNLADSRLAKSPNQLLIGYLHCSPGMASELIKVAKTCYTSLGNFNNEYYAMMRYTDLVELSDKKYDEIRDVATTLYLKNKPKTRKDMKDMLNSLLTAKLGIESSGDVKADKTDKADKADKTDKTDKTDNTDKTDKTDKTDIQVEPNYKEALERIAKALNDDTDNVKRVECVLQILIEFGIVEEM